MLKKEWDRYAKLKEDGSLKWQSYRVEPPHGSHFVIMRGLASNEAYPRHSSFRGVGIFYMPDRQVGFRLIRSDS